MSTKSNPIISLLGEIRGTERVWYDTWFDDQSNSFSPTANVNAILNQVRLWENRLDILAPKYEKAQDDDLKEAGKMLGNAASDIKAALGMGKNLNVLMTWIERAANDLEDAQELIQAYRERMKNNPPRYNVGDWVIKITQKKPRVARVDGWKWSTLYNDWFYFISYYGSGGVHTAIQKDLKLAPKNSSRY